MTSRTTFFALGFLRIRLVSLGTSTGSSLISSLLSSELSSGLRAVSCNSLGLLSKVKCTFNDMLLFNLSPYSRDLLDLFR